MPHQKRKRSGSLHRHDHTNQTTPKRRRLGSSASRTQHRTPPSAIQRETTSTDNVSISGHSSAQPERKLKRRRPKTAGIRRELCQGIEKLLRMDPSPIGHLFASCDEEGAPQAEFEEVLKFLNIDMEKLSNLSHQVICSISNETDIFCVDQNSDTGKLFVKFYPLTFDPDDATVYVDNLPDGANSEKLRRLADLFGNVVSVKLPLKPPRWVQTPRGRADMGSKPQKFGFIQFTHSDSVDQFRKAYNKNFPLEARRKNSETASHQLAMETLKKKIRILARKRYRRNLHESLKLSRLRRVFASMRKKELQLAKKEKQKINGELPYPCRSLLSTPNQSLSTENLKEASPTISKDRESKEVSFSEPPKIEEEREHQEVQKKSRRRRKKNRQDPAYIQGSIREFFADIQVFPLKEYKRMRSQYLHLKKERHKKIAKDATGPLKKQKLEGKKLAKRLIEYRDKTWSTSDENRG